MPHLLDHMHVRTPIAVLLDELEPSDRDGVHLTELALR